jgi:hypothetical protein
MGRSFGIEDSGSATARRGGAAVLWLRRWRRCRLSFCDARKKVAGNGAAQSFGRSGDNVAGRRRSCGTGAVELR